MPNNVEVKLDENISLYVKSRSQDNPLNPLENNRTRKTNGV